MRRALVLAAAVVGVVLSAAPAAAHATLIGSDPEDGATVGTPPAVVTLEFSEPVPQDFTQVAVLDADDQHFEDGAPEVVGGVVTQAVLDLPAGEYRISYRVGSSDGHPVTGVVSFTVSVQDAGVAEASPTPALTEPPEQTSPTPASDAPEPTEQPTVEQPTATEVAAAGDEDSGSSLPWLGAGAAVAAAAALLFVLLRRPGAGEASSEPDTGQQ